MRQIGANGEDHCGVDHAFFFCFIISAFDLCRSWQQNTKRPFPRHYGSSSGHRQVVASSAPPASTTRSAGGRGYQCDESRYPCGETETVTDPHQIHVTTPLPNCQTARGLHALPFFFCSSFLHSTFLLAVGKSTKPCKVLDPRSPAGPTHSIFWYSMPIMATNYKTVSPATTDPPKVPDSRPAFLSINPLAKWMPFDIS